MFEPNFWTLAILGGLVGVPLVLLLIYSHFERAWEHAERLQALQRGEPVPRPSRTRPLWQCLLVGAGVPLFVSFIAFMIDYQQDPWRSVSAIALLTAIPSVLLTLRLPVVDDRSTQFTGKPAFDSEAYDAVIHRG